MGSSSLILGGIAQLGEHLPCTQEVIGSIPFPSTIYLGVVQLARISGLDPEGCRFKSCHPDHRKEYMKELIGEERFKRLYLGEWPKEKEEYQIRVEGELAFSVKPDMTAFLNVALPDSYSCKVTPYIRMSRWERIKFWFYRLYRKHITKLPYYRV